MSYIIAVLFVVLFSLIYMISYRLNNKVKIECDKKSCEGCLMQGCINRFKEEEK